MKIQDILFVAILLLCVIRKVEFKSYFTIAFFCIAISIPLFYKWIFFTAERLVMYAWVCTFVGTMLILKKLRHTN